MSNLLSAPRTILLTGATSGVGAALCSLLLAQGHAVIAVSRRASRLEPRRALATFDCDLSDPGAVRATTATILARHPDVGIVVNNAAVQHARALTDPGFDPADAIEEAQVNLVAPTLIAHAALATLLAADAPAAIVNVGSGLAFHPKRDTGLYCASKAALHSFSQSLRYQLEGTNVRVIEAILPLVDTPMTAGRGTGKLAADAAARAILAGIARGRDEIFVGKARLLRVLDAIVPAIPRKVLKAS
jgi:short-subunit dehydrogenase involved in D-alanine esterification of teichoic acids